MSVVEFGCCRQVVSSRGCATVNVPKVKLRDLWVEGSFVAGIRSLTRV